MDENLESNILIKTKFARPNREGIISTGKDLDLIEKKLIKLTANPWIIKLAVDDKDLERYKLQARRAAQKEATAVAGGGAGAGPLGGGITGGFSNPAADNLLSRRLKVAGDTVTLTEKERQILGSIEQTRTRIRDEEGERNDLILDELNLQKQLLISDEKRARVAAIRRREDQRQARLAAEGRQLGQTVREDVSRGQFPLTFGQGDSFLFDRIQAAEREAVQVRAIREKERSRELLSIQGHEKKVAAEHVKSTLTQIGQAEKARNSVVQSFEKSIQAMLRMDDKFKREELGLQLKQDRRIASGHAKATLSEIAEAEARRNSVVRTFEKSINQMNKLDDKFAKEDIQRQFKQDAAVADSHRKTTLKQIDNQEKVKKNAIKAMDDAINRMKAMDEKFEQQETRQVLRGQQRMDARQAADYRRNLERVSRQQGAQAGVQQALGQGFVARPDTTSYDTVTNQMTRIHNLTRTTGNAFTGYKVEVLRANEATGVIKGELLEGARAMKFLGDSTVRAIAKVALWTVATTAVFGAMLAIRQASTEIAQLEENTVFLARVGREFAGGSNAFEDRYESARKLTDQIIELTTVIGGNAAEAQRAAAIFARAGRDEQETLEATRVALLAARIAELEVEDAARLLSAAMLQFDLSAGQLLPTLDSLNTLSNRYRVSTDDLLQSISRTGAVYAEHNGRLTELASLTAVVSQATARSGAEIGNALKTISSNLDRLEVQQSLFDKMGVSTVNFEGNAKSLGQVLIEIRSRMDELSTAEQKQLGLQIAGIRQRNILVSSIDEVDNAVIAENKTLLESGSAMTEFRESAGTVTAALDRLRGTLIQIAEQGGAQIRTFVTTLLNILNVVLKLLTVFDGLPIKILIAVAGFRLLQRAIGGAYLATASFVQSTLASISANQLAGASLLSRAGASAAFTAATNAATASVTAFNLATGLGAVALIASVTLLNEASVAATTYADALNESSSGIEQSIEAENRKQQALANTTAVVSRLIQEYDRLNAEGKPEEANKIRQRAERIAASTRTATSPGIDLSGGNFSIENLVAQERALETDILKAKQGELNRLYRYQTEALAESTGELAKQQLILANLGGAPGRLTLSGYESRAEIEREVIRILEEQAKLRRDMEETDQTITNNKEQELDLNEKGLEHDRLRSRILKDRIEFEDIGIRQGKRDFRSAIDPFVSAKLTQESFAEIDTATEDALDNLNQILDLRKEIGSQELAEDFKRVNDLLKQRRDLYQKISELTIKTHREGVGTIFGTRNELITRAGEIALDRERGLSNASQYSDPIAKIDLQRQQQLRRLKEAESASSELSTLGGLQAAREEQQAAITRLKELEADKAISILEAEKNIALERKKSADEAARALGSLSEEDKLRVRAQAAYFSANPAARVDVATQFGMDAASSGILNRFFAGRAEDLSEDRSGLADTLSAAGFGSTRDLERGAADVAAARGGRTDQQILTAALNTINQMQEQLMRARGDQQIGGLGDLGASIGFGAGAFAPGGGVDTSITGVISGDKIRLEPLIESFEEAVTVRYQELVDELTERVRAMYEAERALNKKNRPRVAGGAVE